MTRPRASGWSQNREGRRAPRGRLVVVAVVALGLVPATAHASAVPGSGQELAGVSIDVAPGFGGRIAAGRPYPVTVTVTADRLVLGTLVISVPTAAGWQTFRQRVEVVGGTSREHHVIAPGGFEQRALVRAQVVSDDGGRTEEARAQMTYDPADEVVGQLPGSLHAPVPFIPFRTVTLAVDDVGFADLRTVDPALLDLGPLAIAPLDQLVATPDDLTGLSEARRTALTTWVEQGGQLLVITSETATDAAQPTSADPDAPGAGAVDAGPIHVDAAHDAIERTLPEGWARPAVGAPARAGLGQVRLVGESWDDELLPSPTRSSYEEGLIADDLGGWSVAYPLADLARVEFPSAGWLGGGLVAYVVVVGPLAFVAVRLLRRRTLAWAVVPAVALLTTSVAIAAGETVRPEDVSTQVTVYETGPGGTMATTWSLLSRRLGGEVAVTLPPGWTAGPTIDPVTEQQMQPIEVESGVGERGEGVVRADTDTGGFALVTAAGPVAGLEDALVVTARSQRDGEVVGTVRNQLDVPLEGAAAIVNRSGIADLGSLAPGEERAFTVAEATTFQWGGPHPEDRLWPADQVNSSSVGGTEVRFGDEDTWFEPSAPGVGPVEPAGNSGDSGDSDGVVVPAAWREIVRQTGWNYRPAGQVVVVGWTDQLPGPVRPTDDTARMAHSPAAVVARANVEPARDRLTDAVAVRSLVRGPITERGMLDAPNEGGTDALFAFSIPRSRPATASAGARPGGGSSGEDSPGDEPRRLVAGIPPWYVAAEVWVGDRWVPLDIPNEEGGVVPIPPQAVVDGTVFVRAAIESGPPEGGRNFVLYEQEAA